MGRVQLERHPAPDKRRCIRLMAMLAELHKAGYQRLRAMPYASGSGHAWRFAIAPATRFHRDHGAMLSFFPAALPPGTPNPHVGERFEALFTSAEAPNETFFGWPGSAGLDARALAAMFLERKSDLAAAGKGWDHAYAGWYQRMLGLAERGWFPEVSEDTDPARVRGIPLIDLRPEDWRRADVDAPLPDLPFPSGGELRADHFE